MQMGALSIVTGEAVAPDCYKAFDAALGKAAKQLRRLKRALRDDKPIGPDKGALLRKWMYGTRAGAGRVG